MSRMKVSSFIGIITIISFIVATKCFSFVGIEWSGIRYYVWGVFMVWLIARSNQQLDYKMMPCFTLIVINIIFPIISIIPCYLYHHQSLLDSLRAVYGLSYPWLLYIFLHKYNAPSKKIINIICILGIIWTFLEIIQQFSYPTYLFAVRTHGGDPALELSQRNGIWRYMIQPWFVGYLACVYFWAKYLLKRKMSYFVCFFICLIGVYLYVTRVIIFSIIAIILFSLFFSRNVEFKHKVRIAIFIAIVSIPIYTFREELLGSLLDQTVKQYENSETDIRVVATAFYGYEYFPHILTNLFGNGIPFPDSSYGKEINYYEKDMGLYRSDIGIIGDYNLYGITYIFALVWGLWRFFKLRKFFFDYQIYSMIGLLLGYYIMSIFQTQSQSVVLAMMFYLCDKAYSKNYNKIFYGKITK